MRRLMRDGFGIPMVGVRTLTWTIRGEKYNPDAGTIAAPARSTLYGEAGQKPEKATGW